MLKICISASVVGFFIFASIFSADRLGSFMSGCALGMWFMLLIHQISEFCNERTDQEQAEE